MIVLVHTVAYRECSHLYFPPGPNGETFGLNKGLTAADVNHYTGGWFISNVTRLMFTNGAWDPWLYATVSSPDRPGGPLQSTSQLPVNVVPGGSHAGDLATANAAANKGDRVIRNEEVEQLAKWVKEWPGNPHD